MFYRYYRVKIIPAVSHTIAIIILTAETVVVRTCTPDTDIDTNST